MWQFAQYGEIKYKESPITSFSVRPFRRWRSGRAELFGKALVFYSSQLARRIDRNRNAQRTINHRIPKRNSYAVTSIKTRLLKSNRSHFTFPEEFSRSFRPSFVATNIRLPRSKGDRDFFFSPLPPIHRLTLNRCTLKFLTYRGKRIPMDRRAAMGNLIFHVAGYNLPRVTARVNERYDKY